MSAEAPPGRVRRVPDFLAPWTAPEPGLDAADACVTIVLRERRDDVETLLIERSTRADDPASGQVALPGGHLQEGDRSLLHAALRELHEEVGLLREELDPPPRFLLLTEARAFGLRVAVFGAGLSALRGAPRIASPSEVAQVFWAPRRTLDQVVPSVQSTRLGRVEVDAVVIDGHVLWGFTRRVLSLFFGLPASDGVRAIPPSGETGGPEPGR